MAVPVVLFVYNRLDHTERVLDTLAKNLLAKETDLYIFSDASKSEKGKDAVEKVRTCIHKEEWNSFFRSITITEAEKNKGLATSIIGGVTEVINKYGKVIVLEDDLILSKYFLKYMNGALDFYEAEEDIWSISGYSFPMKSLKKYPHDVFYSYRGCSWGWGTWADRWEKSDWEVKDYDEFVQDSKWQKHFNRGGGDLTRMLELQRTGVIDSWAIRWVFTQSNLNMYTIYPKDSYLENDGCDGSGTNSGTHQEFVTELQEKKSDIKFECVGLDSSITREFYRKYTDTLDKKIKRKIIKLFGEKK